jgi:hypothetical protein
MVKLVLVLFNSTHALAWKNTVPITVLIAPPVDPVIQPGDFIIYGQERANFLKYGIIRGILLRPDPLSL